MNRSYVLSKSLKGAEIRHIREALRMSRQEFATFANCSGRTLERWEREDAEVTGPIVSLLEILTRDNQLPKRLELPEMESRLRLIYKKGFCVCTVIDVNETAREVQIRNYVRDPMLTAFGVNTEPTYEEYEAFLESRCFPRTRDKMKLELRKLGIPFYDPLLIIEKTEGRMAEDDFRIEIVRRKG